MYKLSIYREEHGTFIEALNCDAIYQSPGDQLLPEADSGFALYLRDVRSMIQTVCAAAGRDDLIYGSVVHDVFWDLDELISHFEGHDEWPDDNYPELAKQIANKIRQTAHTVETFEHQYTKEIEQLVNDLPDGVKLQVIKLAAGVRNTVTKTIDGPNKEQANGVAFSLKEAYSTAEVSTGVLTERDMNILDNEVKNNDFSIVASRPTGYFVKIPVEGLNEDGDSVFHMLSKQVQSIFIQAHEKGIQCIEFDRDIE